MKRFVKVLSLMLATFLAVSVFSVNSYAMSAEGEAHRRQLTTEEIKTIYPMFNAKEYAKMYPDVKNELGEDEKALYTHFVTFGIWEQRQPSVAFNVDVFASFNYDLQAAYGDDIVAYYTHFATHAGEYPVMPTKYNALRQGRMIYSVYDFVKGQTGPKKGAVPVQTANYHPGIELND